MNVKKTYPKILLLIFSSSIIFIMLYFSLYYYTKKVENQVYIKSTEQFNSEIKNLINLDSKPITVSINNDTNWDEFVNFVNKKDIAWYNNIIAKELNIYKADYMIAYNADKKFITHTTTNKIKTEKFIPEQAMTQLNTCGLSKFYMKIPDGYVEVFGAAVHPSFDLLKNKTKTSGYFFVVRLIDKKYLHELEKLTNSKISFIDENKQVNKSKNIINSNLILKDSENKTTCKLLFTRNFEIFFENITNILYLIIFAFVINLILNLFFTRKLVYYPLELIRKVLKTGNKNAIRELKETSGEFRYIGNLFEENSRQKKELVNAKLKAEESDRLKSSFLANLSHEIRTPMNAINGFTELLISTQLNETERLEYLTIIEKSGKNLVSIIDDLIEMSKIDSNQITPNFTPVNLEACIYELYETIKITIPKTKDIELHILKNDFPAEYNIISDEIKLKQIIVNLVTNGIKYTEKGTVSFGYEINKKNKTIKFSIADTGLGIDKENQKYIFDRFKRVESDLSIKEGGLGLGLAISKAYVEMLNGSITLKSNVGEGSIFSFTIPLKYDTVQKIIVQPINEILNPKKEETYTILIAEDDNINFLLFQKMMSLKNYQIIRAINGKEAVEICLNNPNLDLVLMDIKMPLMNGFEALEHIIPIRPNLPIIAQTAYSSSDDRDKIFAAGFSDYIIKPLNRDRLFELINQYLNEKK